MQAITIDSNSGQGPPLIADDTALVRRCRDGDLAAFDTLVLRYQDKVYNAVYRMVGHTDDARDLTQEAFLKALSGLENFRGGSGFYTWIFRIATNAAISHRRRARRTDTADMTASDAPLPGTTLATGSGFASPTQSAETNEAAIEVQQALNRLDAEFRAALVLKDIEGCDYEEIAEILDVPLGTVKSRIHRARMEMRRLLSSMLS